MSETGRIEAFSDGVFAIAITLLLLWRRAAVNDRLLHAHARRQAVQRIFDSYRYGPFWYVIAFMLSFVSVTAGVVVNLVLAIFFARPTSAPDSSHQRSVS